MPEAPVGDKVPVLGGSAIVGPLRRRPSNFGPGSADMLHTHSSIKTEEHKVAEVQVGVQKRRASSFNQSDASHFHVKEITAAENHGLTSKEVAALLLIHGKNELLEKTTPGWKIFLGCLWGPMPGMLWIALITEYALGSYPDGSILLFVQIANALMGWYETNKAQGAVAALKNALKPTATVKRDGAWQNIDGTFLVPGDLVKIGSGSNIPADCMICENVTVEIDEAALTGESLPVEMGLGAQPKMGSTCVRGEVEATVQFTGSKTFLGKTALLLGAVTLDIGNIYKVLFKVMVILTGLALLLCLSAFAYLLAHYKTSLKEAIEFTVVLLVVSIPIAIEIVVTTTLALGSRELSKKKVVVTRLSAIEMMAAVDILCSDKTGTLTLNCMQIQDYCPVYDPQFNLKNVLVLAALAAKWKEPPRDALDTMVLGAADLKECDRYEQPEFMPFDAKIKRTQATLRGPDGVVFKVTKGAPHVILNLCVNRDAIHEAVEKEILVLASRGVRCLAVARTFDAGENYVMAGILTFLDPPRPDTKDTIARSRKYGVGVKMITGDHCLIAKEMARMLDLGDDIQTPENLPTFPESGDPKDIPKDLGTKYGPMIEHADGFAQVFPEHKYLIVESLRQAGWTTAMTGDGVNDAPALKRADVGIAVHGATDAARAAASMVITEPGLSVVVEAMIIARGVFQRMQSFITYRISATLQLLFFFWLALFCLPPTDYGYGLQYDEDGEEIAGWEAERYFHLPVLMVRTNPTQPKPASRNPKTLTHPISPPLTLALARLASLAPQFMLITLLNDGTLLCIGYDKVLPSPEPQTWDLVKVFTVSTVLAAIAFLSSQLLLWVFLDSGNPDGLFQKSFGGTRLEYGTIVTSIYLKISISDFLTLFSCRTQDKWFFQVLPSKILLVGACFSLLVSSLIACYFEGEEGGIQVRGLTMGNEPLLAIWIWIYCILWWFIQDACKVATLVVYGKMRGAKIAP